MGSSICMMHLSQKIMSSSEGIADASFIVAHGEAEHKCQDYMNECQPPWSFDDVTSGCTRLETIDNCKKLESN